MRNLCRGLAFAALMGSSLFTAGAAFGIEYKIVTASPRGTYIEIGRDLAKFVAPAADVQLEALPSAGSAENVRRLRHEPGVKFALVQSDVYQAYLDQAAAGNREARGLISPLRLILPLYNEEIYFVARQDAPFDKVHEIRDQRISMGPIGSGTALTAATLYRQMFGSSVADDKAQFQSNEDGLSKLVTDKSVDVVIIVAGQPAKVLADMKPEAKALIKLLKFDAQQPGGQEALKTYFDATVRAASYPNLLTEDIPSVAVKAFLVTYNYDQGHTRRYLGNFAQSLCENFAKLQAEGHPKWKEVKLEMPEVGRGWTYFPETTRRIRSCLSPAATPATAATPAPSPAPARRACNQQERILGICN
ncbi:MAG: TAXI family TRAP transporter solute-binding subunit [Lautropia sp.]|nr:TAXI family TRAP transporter solute-binding subunit [Lautropia sp.]